MNPLVHRRGMVANPLNDIIHINDVCGLYIERPREEKIHLTKTFGQKFWKSATEENNFLSLHYRWDAQRQGIQPLTFGGKRKRYKGSVILITFVSSNFGFKHTFIHFFFNPKELSNRGT